MDEVREIHPLEPQRHRHSMLVPRVCAPRVTRCSLGHVIWSVQLACSILSRSDSCQGDGRQRHLRMQAQYPLPVYYSQMKWSSSFAFSNDFHLTTQITCVNQLVHTTSDGRVAEGIVTDCWAPVGINGLTYQYITCVLVHLPYSSERAHRN